MKHLPASLSPTVARTRSKKYCLKIFGSSVEPDLLETMNRVLLIWILSSQDLICAGSVESKTWSSGKPAILPKVFRITSGQRLEPPIPSRSTCAKSSFRNSSANALKRSTLLRCSSTMSSQPSHLLSSAPVHNDASRAHNLRTLSAFVHRSKVAFTPSDNSRGKEKVCEFMFECAAAARSRTRRIKAQTPSESQPDFGGFRYKGLWRYPGQ